MRTEKQWIIVNEKSGVPALFDGRCPIYWRRKVAQDTIEEHNMRGFEVVQCEVSH